MSGGDSLSPTVDFVLNQLWWFVTCTLCCVFLPGPAYDPWCLIYEEQSFQTKIVRGIWQFTSAIFLAWLVALADYHILTDYWDFKTDFLVVDFPRGANGWFYVAMIPNQASNSSTTPLPSTFSSFYPAATFSRAVSFDEGAILNEAAHTGLLYATSALAAEALSPPAGSAAAAAIPAGCLAWAPSAASGALLVAIGLSPWQTTGPSFSPLISVLWAAKHHFDARLAGAPPPPDDVDYSCAYQVVGTLVGALWAFELAVPAFGRAMSALRWAAAAALGPAPLAGAAAAGEAGGQLDRSAGCGGKLEMVLSGEGKPADGRGDGGRRSMRRRNVPFHKAS